MSAPPSGEGAAAVQAVLQPLLAGAQPPAGAARSFMDLVMQGAVDEGLLAAVLVALRFTPPTAETLAAFARAIRGHMVRVPVGPGPLLDTCGTGGSGLDTANTSTMAAFVVAACGVRVAKHGNRASSGRCGSSDLLAALGVPLVLPPERSAALIDEVGLAFLFAPGHHPAFRHVGPLRKRLGVRTVFNLLGPLCNPAGADHQLLGVSDPALAPVMAGALRLLGSRRVLVVHGTDGLDELSASAPSHTWTVDDNGVKEGMVSPDAFGLAPVPLAAVQGGDVATNVAIFHAVMAGEDTPHARLVRLNAAAALTVAGAADALPAALALATEALRSGAARDCFARYRAGAGGTA